jgi:hypothetical protein
MIWRKLGISVDGHILDSCVTVVLSCYKHLNTEKNRVQVVQLPVIWAKSHVIANKQQALYGAGIAYCVLIAIFHSLECMYI